MALKFKVKNRNPNGSLIDNSFLRQTDRRILSLKYQFKTLEYYENGHDWIEYEVLINDIDDICNLIQKVIKPLQQELNQKIPFEFDDDSDDDTLNFAV